MQQTSNQGYNLVENTDEINQSLQAWNGNFNKLDASVTSAENGIEAFSDNYEPKTVEGTDLYITDSASAPIKDISIGENSEITQDGEPTPENEVEVNVVKGECTLEVKNEDNTKHQSYPITLLQGMFLGKIGNASNYIYGDIDNWKLVSGLKLVKLLSSFNWAVTNNGYRYYVAISDLATARGSAVKSNYFSAGDWTTNEGIAVGNGTYNFLSIGTSHFNSIDTLKTFLDENDVYAYCELLTPAETQITDTTLISQLNTIKRNMTTYKDGTIIFTVTDGLNPSIKLTYGLNPEIETNEKVAEVQSELDMLKSNFDVKTSPNSDNMNITDAINDYNQGNIKIGDGTELTQKTTEGKNLFDKDKITDKRGYDGNIGETISTSSNNNTFIIEKIIASSNFITISSKKSTATARIRLTDENDIVRANTSYTSLPITIDTSTYKNIYIMFASSTITINDDIQIEEGSTATDYEEYTGGQPSPNPDYPQTVNVVEGECGVEESNKNLFDKSNTSIYHRYNSTANLNEDKSITVTSTGVNGYVVIAPYVKYEIGKTYTVSFDVDNINKLQKCNMFISKYSTISGTPPTTNSLTFTLGDNETNTLWLGVYPRTGETITISNIQVEESPVISSYITHKGKSFDLTLPEGMFLGSIGTASNYIKGTKNNWKLHKGIGKSVFDGTENWGYDVNSLFFVTSSVSNFATTNNIPYCNYFKGVSNVNGGSSISDGEVAFINSTLSNRMYIKNSSITSAEDFKYWLSTHNLEVYYRLKTSAEEIITDTTLIEQLNNIIDNLQTYKGGTVVFTSGESLAPNIQFDYLQNPLSSIEARLDLLEA